MGSRSQVLIQSPAFILALLVCLANIAPAARSTAAPVQPPSRVCGTPDVSSEEAKAIDEALAAGKSPHGATLGGLVQIAFHVIHDGTEGDVTDEQIEAQIAELNLNFSGASGGHDTGYRFVLATVDRTLEPDWFTMGQNSQEEHRAKQALAVDPAHHVNVYTAKIAAYGWATYPWGISEEEKDHGIVVHYGTLPGGHLTGYNMGRTVTHEIGHYFGLFHTFFTGCSILNDYVEDTPAEANPAAGCPPDTLDTCESAGMDPIHNFMDYSDDTCYREFTAGQDGRMDAMVGSYRPSLVGAPLQVAGGAREVAVALAPVAPNPTQGAVEFRFTLPGETRVRLRIHDLAGRALATILDEVLPGGEHHRAWKGGPRPSGVCFAVLEARGERVVRRFVVAH